MPSEKIYSFKRIKSFLENVHFASTTSNVKASKRYNYKHQLPMQSYYVAQSVIIYKSSKQFLAIEKN